MEHIEIFNKLKERSGSHSPSIEELKERLGVRIKIDACFLSNPYATELFMKYLQRDIIEPGLLRDLLEFYPQQNRDIASILSTQLKIPHENLFIGNGAIEVIQATLHRVIRGKIAIPIPTFSSYYEFLLDVNDAVFYNLEETKNFKLDLNLYEKFIRKNNLKNALIINPNNPDGSYLSRQEILKFLENNRDLEGIIIDESFGHFAYEDADLKLTMVEEVAMNFGNTIVIKSMSKDFGIAGIRAGYGIMNKEHVDKLLSSGYLWNLNGLAAYFFKVYCQEGFQCEYEIVRKKYIMNTITFWNELSRLKGIYVLPSKANFVLLKVQGMSSRDLMINLLVNYGIYVRDCSDKIGLPDGYIRVASRSFEENQEILRAIKEISK
jgi:histidinol-phosphate/aromatic aminotransferase/cobyric acid decarboxylase-like protein